MLININIDCDKCMECVEVCQNEVLTEIFINLVKLILKDNQKISMTVPTVNPEWGELQ